MWVFLSNTNKHNWFARRINHVESSSNFIIDSIKLGHDNSVNDSWVVVLNGKVNQALVEFSQLIDGVITHKSFTNKKNCVWFVNVDKLCKCFHQGFVALHSSSCINQHNIVMFVSCFCQSFFSNDCSVVFVTLLIQRNIKTLAVSLKLLNCP